MRRPTVALAWDTALIEGCQDYSDYSDCSNSDWDYSDYWDYSGFADFRENRGSADPNFQIADRYSNWFDRVAANWVGRAELVVRVGTAVLAAAAANSADPDYSIVDSDYYSTADSILRRLPRDQPR